MTSAEYGHFVLCVSKQPTLFTFQFVNTCCGALVCCHAPVETFEGTGQVAQNPSSGAVVQGFLVEFLKCRSSRAHIRGSQALRRHPNASGHLIKGPGCCICNRLKQRRGAALRLRLPAVLEPRRDQLHAAISPSVIFSHPSWKTRKIVRPGLHGHPAFVKIRLHRGFCRIRTFCLLRVEAIDPVYISIRKHLLWCFSLLPCSSQNLRRNRAGRFDCCHGVSMLQNKQCQICIVTSAETDILLWLVEWCH